MKVCLALLGLILFTTAAQAGSTGEHDFFETVGTRFGFGNNRGTRITDFEFFATSRPLRSWDFSREISASLHFETGLGLLSHRSDESSWLERAVSSMSHSVTLPSTLWSQPIWPISRIIDLGLSISEVTFSFSRQPDLTGGSPTVGSLVIAGSTFRMPESPA